MFDELKNPPNVKCHESWVGQSTKTVNVKELVTPELTNSQSSWHWDNNKEQRSEKSLLSKSGVQKMYLLSLVSYNKNLFNEFCAESWSARFIDLHAEDK